MKFGYLQSNFILSDLLKKADGGLFHNMRMFTAYVTFSLQLGLT